MHTSSWKKKYAIFMDAHHHGRKKFPIHVCVMKVDGYLYVHPTRNIQTNGHKTRRNKIE